MGKGEFISCSVSIKFSKDGTFELIEAQEEVGGSRGVSYPWNLETARGVHLFKTP